MIAIFDREGKPLTTAFRGGLNEVIAFAKETRLSLRNADLRDADLSELDLSGMDLTDANLSGALLMGAKLDGAILHSALALRTQFSTCSLVNADLTAAFLTGANFNFADLTGATLHNCSLKETTWHEARVFHASLTGAELAEANDFVQQIQALDFNIIAIEDSITINDDRKPYITWIGCLGEWAKQHGLTRTERGRVCETIQYLHRQLEQFSISRHHRQIEAKNRTDAAAFSPSPQIAKRDAAV